MRDRRARRRACSRGGVRTAIGRHDRRAARAVICNVTPTQLYGQLLDGYGAKAERFRYGRSEMQIHFALSEPPRWDGDERLGGTAIVHLTPGLDGVSRAVNEAERGLLPAEATVVVGQPLTMDPSRAPEGKGILWIQLQELPWRIKGDAAGELDVGDGTWTREPARALRRPHPGAARAAHPEPRVVDPRRASRSRRPTCRTANINLVHGDPYGGSLALDQNFLWRPLASQPGHRTPVDGVWHIGASTHPGPGPRRGQRRARRAAAARAAVHEAHGSAACAARVRVCS